MISWSELHRCRRCQGRITLDEGKEVNPSSDCVCPSGPVWRLLEARPIGRKMLLMQARLSWESAKRPRMVYYFREGVRCEMDMRSWKQFLARNWDDLLAYEPSESVAS